jgi:hypothetical protein
MQPPPTAKEWNSSQKIKRKNPKMDRIHEIEAENQKQIDRINKINRIRGFNFKVQRV